MSLIEKVVQVAYRYVGSKETPGNNSGFADPKFLAEMKESGWQLGQSWCAYFAETIFRIALEEENRAALWDKLEPLFSAGAVDTLNRFRKAGYTVRQTPQVGDLVVWRFGVGPSGHIGIVVAVGNPQTKQFTTVEGNTSKSGSDIVRDADQVAVKTRRYGLKDTAKGFNLLGFIAPVG